MRRGEGRVQEERVGAQVEVVSAVVDLAALGGYCALALESAEECVVLLWVYALSLDVGVGGHLLWQLQWLLLKWSDVPLFQ